jgi:kynurenine formamidase
MKNLLFFLVLLITACKPSEKKLEAIQWIDLTHPFDSTTLYWPNNIKSFEHYTDANGVNEKGFYYSSYSICTPEHGGTHLDAPIHFAEGKQTVDQIPLSHLTGNAVLIDVSGKALKDRDYRISIEDILAWEKVNGVISDSSIILFRTGYGQYYPDRKKYFGTNLRGLEALPLLHFPGIHQSTAEWLIKNRHIKSVGLDTPSLDYGQSTDFMTHRILMGANVPGFENLHNLDRLPASNIYVVALPMKIGNGSGGPLRIIAGVL